MTYQFDRFEAKQLAQAVSTNGTYSFTLLTADPEDLGVFGVDDQAQIRDGGRFDLSPWAALPSRGLLAGPPINGKEILQDASKIVDYLYLQLDPGAGPSGAGEISATYNLLNGPALRKVEVAMAEPNRSLPDGSRPADLPRDS